MVEPSYILNVQEGKSTLHDAARLTEHCHADDKDRTVDAFDAEAMMIRGDAVPCRFCNPAF